MNKNHLIISTTTQAERNNTYNFFDRILGPLPAGSVPTITEDNLFKSVVLNCFINDELVGALQMAYPMVMVTSPDYYRNVGNKIRELDYVAVDPEHRLDGIGEALMLEAETIAKSEGTLIVYGFVDLASEEIGLHEFFEKLGYTIVPVHQKLPEFFGRKWDTDPVPPKFWFWKRI